MHKHRMEIASTKNVRSLKSSKKENTNTGVIESFKGYITNFSYGLGGFNLSTIFSKKRQHEESLPEKQLMSICGVSYPTLDECHKAHRDLIWFTYRKNFKINLTLHSDVGWGCLIRVAQMAMAHALEKYLILNHKRVQKSYVITAFLEEEGADIKYSLARFLAKGEKIWKIKPGQWYSMTQITTILQALHQNNPIKGSQNLKVKVYNESIDVKDVISAFSMAVCRCSNKSIICQQCQPTSARQPYLIRSYSKSVNNQLESNNRHVFLLVTTTLGEKVVSEQNYECLLQLMEMEMFAGCLGGIANKARFITGRCGEKLSYLDPHYVVQSIDRMGLHTKLQTFSCPDYRLMTREELDPAMSICFYLKNLQDLQNLTKTIDNIRKKSSYQFLKYDWYDRHQDTFEILDVKQRKPKLILKANFDELEESFSDLSSARSSMDSSFYID